MKYPNNNLINTTQKQDMGPTRSLANYWVKKTKILDMYLILIETFWWGHDDDNDDDKKWGT